MVALKEGNMKRRFPKPISQQTFTTQVCKSKKKLPQRAAFYTILMYDISLFVPYSRVHLLGP